MEQDGVGALRTRSKVAPDWTVEESLILVNEVSAVEADCRDTLASFQKWKIIVENCNALGVNRNLNQCRRKWDSLLSDYKKIKQSGSKKASFNSDLFKVIEWYVREYEGGCDTDPDSDPEAVPEPVLASMVQSGSKKQRSKIIPQKRSIEDTPKPKRHIKSEEIKVEESCSEPTNDILNGSMRPEETNQEQQEQAMADTLRENAELIEAIVKEDSMNDESTIDLTRLNGDKLIVCLSNLVVALDQLSEFVQ
ncbi:trihelix transcription factor ASR3 isoform X2 [Cynara cardunculus var. scolymus]|uniref:trihelix transcription factor ASR3 isoform X2 n=1 Tax=Cynara cardunculus var. scolymus TaxID=59895 RepID=UPI000D6243B6|nr:trihelix transcription factor ASR3 isoform X2 [Cynara cardunculus var. scolymus]